MSPEELKACANAIEQAEKVIHELIAENERLKAESEEVEAAALVYMEDMQFAQIEVDRVKHERDQIRHESERLRNEVESKEDSLDALATRANRIEGENAWHRKYAERYWFLTNQASPADWEYLSHQIPAVIDREVDALMEKLKDSVDAAGLRIAP